MTLDRIRSYCLKKPGNVTEDMPFGDEVLALRVGGKIFLLAALNAVPSTINLKCDPERAIELRERYDGVRPGYHMNKKHWNTVVLDGSIPAQEIRAMVDHSFELISAHIPQARAKRESRRK
jgi:predicted DNA-binding protein (MmcQ/YjbR family)